MVRGSNDKNVRHLKPQGARNFTEFVPQCRGIGHLKYHSTPPCTLGKLTSSIIRVYGPSPHEGGMKPALVFEPQERKKTCFTDRAAP